jgi:hypothetical protein
MSVAALEARPSVSAFSPTTRRTDAAMSASRWERDLRAIEFFVVMSVWLRANFGECAEK